MTWHAYRLAYRLRSPLHIGWRKLGNLAQTKPYIPGRSWWGAATSSLTHWLGHYNYPVVGEFVRNNLVFGYFYPAEDPNRPYLPCLINGEMYYGDLIASDFEKRFLGSWPSTAIDYNHLTATEGQLHEVEFVRPRTEISGVWLIGHLFARAGNRIQCGTDEVFVDGVRLLHQVLSHVHLGGERRYGFGKAVLEPSMVGSTSDYFGHRHVAVSDSLLFEIDPDRPLPFHCTVGNCSVDGEIEPWLGREWDEDVGPGRRLSQPLICWVPGSRVKQAGFAEIGPLGIASITPAITLPLGQDE